MAKRRGGRLTGLLVALVVVVVALWLGYWYAAHAVAVEAEHRLIHGLPRLRAATVHADPDGTDGTDHHAALHGHH